mgnify:FL=1|jgi:hypothetical protein
MFELDILSKEQKDLIDLVREFKDDYYLVGGTALALQIGHRRSIDFDLFTKIDFDNNQIIGKVGKYFPVEETFVNQKNQLTVMTHGVKMTWYQYKYPVPVNENWDEVIKMPDVLSIGCMKAFALGQRAKWKDYVDVYFLLKQFSLEEISKKTVDIFGGGLFDEVLLRSQLSYFKDVDYSETVEFMPGFKVDDEIIKTSLADIASRE